MKLQEPIRTPRLVIRSYTNADREFLLSTWGDRENGKYMVDDIGYCIAKDHWQEGLGTEMIGALLQWIRAQGGTSASGEIADLNAGSVALARKLGMAPDEETRYKKWGEETYFDAHIYRVDLTKEGK